MAFKKTSAFIRGTWDGTPDESNFTQDADVFVDPLDFFDYVDAGLVALVDEYETSGDLVTRMEELSADGKVLICTKEYVDEAAHTAFAADPRWSTEDSVTKKYDVELAAAPEDVGTFDEVNQIYFHSSAHLF